MPTQTVSAGKAPAAGAGARPIVRLWREPTRVEQAARLGGMQIQTCDEAGRTAWEQAHRLWLQLPAGVRVDLPSWRVFARVLGVYRSAATLRNQPMQQLELSGAEIAKLAGYGKSTVEAALRWLGSEPVRWFGMVVAQGLGYVERGRRKAKAYLKGTLRDVYRTSVTALSVLGRGVLGLLPAATGKGKALAPRRDRRRRPRPSRRRPIRDNAAPVDVPSEEGRWATAEEAQAALRAIRLRL
jgi:hypothetical protein